MPQIKIRILEVSKPEYGEWCLCLQETACVAQSQKFKINFKLHIPGH
jgi:hypothetical protein